MLVYGMEWERRGGVSITTCESVKLQSSFSQRLAQCGVGLHAGVREKRDGTPVLVRVPNCRAHDVFGLLGWQQTHIKASGGLFRSLRYTTVLVVGGYSRQTTRNRGLPGKSGI